MTMLHTIRKAVSLLSQQEKRRGLHVLVLVIGMALLETAAVASVMPFLAVLGNPKMLDTNPILNAAYNRAQGIGILTPDQFLTFLGIVAFLIIVISAVYQSLTHYAMNRFIEMLRHSVGARLLETYLRQPYEFFLDRHSGDMSKTILSEVDQLVISVYRPAYNMVAYSIVLITMTTLLILVNPWVAMLSAGMLGGLNAVFFLVLRNRLTRLGEIIVTANKERFMAAGEALGGIKDIKLLGHEKAYLSRFRSPSERFAAGHATHQTLNQVPFLLIEAIAIGGIILISIVMLMNSGGIHSGAMGQILPTLGLYAFAAYRLKPAVNNIFQGFTSLRFGRATVDSLFSEMQMHTATPTLPMNPSTKLKAKQTINLEQLSYTYPNAEKPALRNLCLKIPVGSAVGLVGSTGAGKTTMVDVILGLLRPTEGAITVDGTHVNEHNLSAWQQSLGYVPQNIFLTDTSVAENIALGIPIQDIDLELVERCARMAQVHDFIVQELPEQYATVVGERGVRLSGGQRQRIGIARALYRDPEVLVFDEATSALDNVTERSVMDAIDQLAHQKTIIVIAHRLSTVRNCDQIVLLEHGVIKAKGTFAELSNENEQFKLMVDQS